MTGKAREIARRAARLLGKAFRSGDGTLAHHEQKLLAQGIRKAREYNERHRMVARKGW